MLNEKFLTLISTPATPPLFHMLNLFKILSRYINTIKFWERMCHYWKEHCNLNIRSRADVLCENDVI